MKKGQGNPQIKNGYTKIANELLEAYLKISKYLSPYENTIWLAILRKTYGYQKKKDWISRRQLKELTGIEKVHISRTKRKLLGKNMIVCNGGSIGIQKDYKKWGVPKQVPPKKRPKQVPGGTHIGTKKRPKQVPTKERKKLIQKKAYAEFVKLSEGEHKKLIERYGEGKVLEMIEKLDNYKGSNGKTYKSDYRAILNWVADEINKRHEGDIDYQKI